MSYEDILLNQGRDGFIKIWDLDKLPHYTDGAENVLLSFQYSIAGFSKFSSIAITREIKYETQEMVMEHSELIVVPSTEENNSVFLIYDFKLQKIVDMIPYEENTTRGLCMNIKLFKNTHFGSEVLLAAGFEDGSIYIWNLTTKAVLISQKLHDEPLLCFDLNDTCDSGVSGSAGDTVIIFSLNFKENKCEIVEKFKLNHGGISDIKIRQDQRIFASAGWDKRVRIYNWRKHKPLAILKYHSESIFAVDFNFKTQFLASASKDKKIAIWLLYPK